MFRSISSSNKTILPHINTRPIHKQIVLMELPSNSMLAETLDLDLLIAHTYVIARCINRRWPGQCPAITYTETRTMPGALYHVARERSFIKGPTGMRACSRDGV